eukprot:Protomagalhaensia_sp_Gyna_25__60@NODE_102_length_5256_cov_15_981599_g79_i0_p1_GENE_NODE_102_length_5256_cov_15_981599_g79_i0NODE_102_length_5256_cov_15_981599_g79_i0_p1_ORF_typecomplete_len1002_score195_03_NODE_102_length_5256_cov_15_981599_g79_i02223227
MMKLFCIGIVVGGLVEAQTYPEYEVQVDPVEYEWVIERVETDDPLCQLVRTYDPVPSNSSELGDWLVKSVSSAPAECSFEVHAKLKEAVEVPHCFLYQYLKLYDLVDWLPQWKVDNELLEWEWVSGGWEIEARDNFPDRHTCAFNIGLAIDEVSDKCDNLEGVWEWPAFVTPYEIVDRHLEEELKFPEGKPVPQKMRVMVYQHRHEDYQNEICESYTPVITKAWKLSESLTMSTTLKGKKSSFTSTSIGAITAKTPDCDVLPTDCKAPDSIQEARHCLRQSPDHCDYSVDFKLGGRFRNLCSNSPSTEGSITAFVALPDHSRSFFPAASVTVAGRVIYVFDQPIQDPDNCVASFFHTPTCEAESDSHVTVPAKTHLLSVGVAFDFPEGGQGDFLLNGALGLQLSGSGCEGPTGISEIYFNEPSITATSKAPAAGLPVPTVSFGWSDTTGGNLRCKVTETKPDAIAWQIDNCLESIQEGAPVTFRVQFDTPLWHPTHICDLDETGTQQLSVDLTPFMDPSVLHLLQQKPELQQFSGNLVLQTDALAQCNAQVMLSDSEIGTNCVSPSTSLVHLDVASTSQVSVPFNPAAKSLIIQFPTASPCANFVDSVSPLDLILTYEAKGRHSGIDSKGVSLSYADPRTKCACSNNPLSALETCLMETDSDCKFEIQAREAQTATCVEASPVVRIDLGTSFVVPSTRNWRDTYRSLGNITLAVEGLNNGDTVDVYGMTRFDCTVKDPAGLTLLKEKVLVQDQNISIEAPPYHTAVFIKGATRVSQISGGESAITQMVFWGRKEDDSQGGQITLNLTGECAVCEDLLPNGLTAEQVQSCMGEVGPDCDFEAEMRVTGKDSASGCSGSRGIVKLAYLSPETGSWKSLASARIAVELRDPVPDGTPYEIWLGAGDCSSHRLKQHSTATTNQGVLIVDLTDTVAEQGWTDPPAILRLEPKVENNSVDISRLDYAVDGIVSLQGSGAEATTVPDLALPNLVVVSILAPLLWCVTI